MGGTREWGILKKRLPLPIGQIFTVDPLLGLSVGGVNAGTVHKGVLTSVPCPKFSLEGFDPCCANFGPVSMLCILHADLLRGAVRLRFFSDVLPLRCLPNVVNPSSATETELMMGFPWNTVCLHRVLLPCGINFGCCAQVESASVAFAHVSIKSEDVMPQSDSAVML